VTVPVNGAEADVPVDCVILSRLDFALAAEPKSPKLASTDLHFFAARSRAQNDLSRMNMNTQG
jgi:hypothetical protein